MPVTTTNARAFSNGHYYAFTKESAHYSNNAKPLSTGSLLDRLNSYGYLATVTSQEENNFIVNYSYGGSKIPNNGFIGGSDASKEGTWIWEGGPEVNQTFRTGGANTMFASWNSGEPNNKNNEDFLVLYNTGYWNDADPDSVGGYVTEWGKAGAQFGISFSSNPPVNAFEGSTSSASKNGSFALSLDNKVYSDYAYNGKALIDIPVTFGGTAIYNTDYTISVTGGGSSYDASAQKLYILGGSSPVQDVTISIVPTANLGWKQPRDVSISLGADGSETIYSLTGSTSQRLWIYDDEPTLSLGQGLYQSIYANYNSIGSSGSLPAQADTTIFDVNGIDESDGTFDDYGLYDGFGIRWEGYIRIPESGAYVFKSTTDDGVKLTLRSNNTTGAILDSFTQWKDQAATSYSTKSLSLNKGDVVWMQMDYYDKITSEKAQLSWDRTPTGGTKVSEVIPASAYFLSEEVARGRDSTEPKTGDNTSKAFTVFSNKAYDTSLNVQLNTSTASGNTTINNTNAQQRTSNNSVVGDDYALYSDSAGTQLLAANPSFTWQPTSGALSKELYVKTFSDIYAESSEAITLSLLSNTNSSYANYGIASASQTIKIADQPMVLSFGAVQNPQEGSQGWVEISTNGTQVTNPGGLRVKYTITGGTAARGSDYLAPKATLSTTTYSATDYVYLPMNSTGAKLYITALEDAIREGNETITVELQTCTETNDKGFTYQLYNVDAAGKTASLTIGDNSNFAPGIVITPAERTGSATIRANLVNGKQQASFDVHLLSQPQSNVTVQLASTSGTLSGAQLTFTPSNWDQTQRVTLNDQRKDQVTTVTATSSSSDLYYASNAGLNYSQRIIPSSWTSEVGVTLWEGGSIQQSLPIASATAASGVEGSNGDFGFDLSLSQAVAQPGVELFYALSAGSGFQLSTNANSAADAWFQPERQYNPVTLPNKSTAYVDLGKLTTIANSLGELSAEAWVRLDATNNLPTVLNFTDGSNKNEIILGFQSNSTIPQLIVYNASGKQIGSLVASYALSIGHWSHLAFSVDSSRNASLYVDGNLAASGVLSEMVASKSRATNFVGRSAAATDSNNGYFHGAIHDLRVWNTSRTAAQIQASLVNALPSGTGLVASYSLNNTASSGLQGSPSAVLKDGAVFANSPFYGTLLPAGISAASLRLTSNDDQQVEGNKQLSLDLLGSSRYSLTGSSGTATSTLSDNDAAGVLFYEWSGNGAWVESSGLQVSEGDTKALKLTPIGLSLATKPTANVTLSVTTDSFSSKELKVFNGEGTGTASNLTFTPDNWDVVQKLNFQGIDDSVDDGDVCQAVSFTVTGTDSAYTALVPTISVTTFDNDATTVSASLASQGGSAAPIAMIGVPSIGVLSEGSSTASTFTLSLSAPATVDTLVFIDIDKTRSQVDASDIKVTGVTTSNTLAGLTLLQQLGTSPETSSTDLDGINENGSTFQGKGLSGAFKSTWSGFIQIKNAGYYSFKTAVQGGVSLNIDGSTVIDKMFDQKGTLTSSAVYFDQGAFVPVTLNYQSYNSQEPKISLSWIRPDQGGSSDVEELVPSAVLTRADGLHLLIPKGATSTSFSLQSLDDSVAEGKSTSLRSEDLVFSILQARGVQLTVTSQSLDNAGQGLLSLSLSGTDRESITLPAGSALSFGQDQSSSSEALATVTLTQAITLHRDRISSVACSVTLPNSTTPYTGNLVDLVSSAGNGDYQTLDPGVNLIARSNWLPDTSGALSGNGQIQLALEATNRGSVTLPAGTVLSYQTTSSDGVSTPLMYLTLLDAVSMTGPSGTGFGPDTTVRVKADNYTTSIPNLVGLSSAYIPPSDAKLTINDNDNPGFLITSDAAGLIPVDSAAIIALKEGDTSVTRYLRLTSQPTQTVTFYLESSDSSEGLLKKSGSSAAPTSRISLTFSPENWSTPQGLQAVPVDDYLVDGIVNFNVKGRAVSSDSFYNKVGSTGDGLKLSTADNDQPGVKVELVQSTISRGGNGFLSLKLTAQPTADVTLSLTPSDNQFTINDRSIGRPETITFTAKNWSVVQQVELLAVDDTATEDVTRSNLTLVAASSDSRFNALSIEPVTVDIVDNDPPTATVQLVNNSTEEAQAGSFRISLSSPAPSSAGSNGVVVNYQISSVSVDPKAGYSIDNSTISKITQSPSSVTGSVRIAPGKSSSDVFVVPIDDFLADSFDKSFQVKLATGNGYVVSANGSENTTTVKIINNDKAGLVIITSGDRALVTEGSGTGQFQIALLSQPGGDVTIDLSEYLPNGAIRQLGDSKAGYTGKYKFTSGNWYIPQVVSFTGWDDNKIEDGTGSLANTGLHSTQLKYQLASSDSDYNSASHSGDNTHFSNTIQTVDVMDRPLPTTTSTSINSSLTSLQEGIDSLSLPMVGSLNGKTGEGIRKFLSKLVNSISAAGAPTPKKLQKLIADGIGISQDAVTVSMKGTDVEVSFKFQDKYTVFSVPLDADFGMPGLGFKSEGTLDAYFNYDAMVGMVFPLSGDIYLNTDPTKTYFKANYSTNLSDDFKLTGGLGFLQLDAVNQPSVNQDIIASKGNDVTTGLNIDFTLDVSGGAGADSKLTLSELTDSKTSFESLFKYQFSGDAAMSFGVTTSVNGSAAIPSFHFDLASLLPLFDYSNKDQAAAPASATNFYFDNIKLDLGTYITGMLSPVVNGIDSILNPLYPIVDALYANTQIFSTIGIAKTFDHNKDGVVSPIDLSQWFADLYATFDPVKGKQLQSTIDTTVEFLDKIKGVMDLVRSLKQMSAEGDFFVDYGSYVLPAYQAGNADKSTEDVVVDDQSTKILNKDTENVAESGGKDSSGKSSSSFSSVMKQLEDLGFEIPLITDPKNVVKLLLGQNVDLFNWRMPSMGMESSIEQSFYIYPGIDGLIEGGFGVNATIGFGFDTYGLNEWRDAGFKASESWKVFDGFYVADRNSDGVDIPEFTLDASMGAGLALSAVVAKASITGGLEAGASFDLLDEGEIAGTADGKIRGQEISSRIDTPLELFTLLGDLSAYLKAKVQIGIDLGFYSVWDTVWEEKLATIPIFEFGIGGSSGSGTASNGYISGGILFWDGNKNGRLDPSEPWTKTGEDASFSLKIDNRSYDTNGNGKIDFNEGRFVLTGGLDTSDGESLSLPMVAPYGQMITPLTTLLSFGLELGYSREQLKAWIGKSFDLAGLDLSTADPVLLLTSQTGGQGEGNGAQRAYLAHVKLNFTLTVLIQALESLLPEILPNTTQAKLAITKAYSSRLLALDPQIGINELLAKAVKDTADSWIHPPTGSNLATPPEIDPDIKQIVTLVGSLAANASYAMSNQLDELLAKTKGKPGKVFLAGVNVLKTKVFQLFRKGVEKLSEGLFNYSGEALGDVVDKRLDAIFTYLVNNIAPSSLATADVSTVISAAPGWSPQNLVLRPIRYTTSAQYRDRGHELSSNSIDFTLQASDPLINPSQASILLDLASLNLTSTRGSRSLSYFTGSNLDDSISFIYDPNSRTGARFYNLQGAFDSLIADLSYVDGERGDTDAAQNGLIQDPGIFGFIAIAPEFSTIARVLEIGDPASQESAAIFTRVVILERSTSSNQVGYLMLKDNELVSDNGLPDISLNELLERYQVLFGTLEQFDVGEQSVDTQYARSLQVSNHNRLVMIEILDSVLADLAIGKNSVSSLGSSVQVLTPTVDGPIVTYSSSSGLRLSLELSGTDPGLNAFLARQQNEAPLLDFSGLGGQGVAGQLEVTKEAAYQSTMGFYRVLDNQGTVLDTRKDSVTGHTLKPGEFGYLEAATSSVNVVTSLSGIQATSINQLTVFEAGRIAPYAVVYDPHRGRLTYSGFAAANPDLTQHFQILGDCLFGFEDLFGGGDRDYDDKVVGFRPSGLVAAPLI